MSSYNYYKKQLFSRLSIVIIITTPKEVKRGGLMRRKLLASALALVMAGSLIACGSGGGGETKAASEGESKETTVAEKSESAGGEKKHYKFGYTCMDGTNPFFVTIQDKIKELVEANGDELIVTDPGNDVTKQISQVEDMLSQKLDGLFMNPVDAQGIIPALDLAKEAGVPMVGFDTEVGDMSYLVSYTGSDNYNAGKVVGEDLVKKAPNGGKIIVLDSPTMQSVVDRTNGFMDAIKDHGFEVVAQQDAKGNLQIAMGIAEDLLQSNPDVVAIFGGNDPTALGALAAANAAGIKDCMIYGVDGSPDIKSELASGESLIEGSGAQSPVSIAEQAVKIMYDYVEGKQVDERYPVETFLITSDNVAQYGTDGWQ